METKVKWEVYKPGVIVCASCGVEDPPHSMSCRYFGPVYARQANRKPQPYVDASDPDGGCDMTWHFPRGMKDKEILAEIERQGYDTQGWPCRCTEGDCCGAIFARPVLITQARRHKIAELHTRRCV